MIWLAIVNAVLLGWNIWLTYQGKSVKGLLTANYIALKRLNNAIEVHEDGQWKFYTEPHVVYMDKEKHGTA